MTAGNLSVSNYTTISATNGVSLTSSGLLYVTGSGSLNSGSGNISLTSTGNDVNVSQGAFVGAVTGSASNFTVRSQADLSASNISAGTLTLATPDSNTLSLLSGANITAGSLTLESGHFVINANLNATIGTLTIESNATPMTISGIGLGTLQSAQGTNFIAGGGSLTVDTGLSITGNASL